MSIDITQVKLGKLPFVHSNKMLPMRAFMKHDYLPSPLVIDYSQGKEDGWGMMLNDRLGCCTIADGPGHATQVWTLNASGKIFTPKDETIEEAYSEWCGYVKGNDATDLGGVETQVLDQWKNNKLGGLLADFAPLDAYVSVHQFIAQDINQRIVDPNDFRFAVFALGGAYAGVLLPITIQDQDVWDVVLDADTNPAAAPGSLGGHAIYFIGYNAHEEVFDFISWGKKMQMTSRFFNRYCDECYGLVSSYWLTKTGLSPSGFNHADLIAKAQQIQ